VDATQLPGAQMVTLSAPTRLEGARRVAEQVVDPEIPVLTIGDLGILRDVELVDGAVVATITPTYSGCPAMAVIEDDLRAALVGAGFDRVKVATVHHPAWSSEWLTEEGREKLAGFGIAPPSPDEDVACPRCLAGSPREVSRFGSTACKALMVCSSCGDPFDRFKEY
jgi:ring-1,2-phenylacetyl-CoA epoxidase subunit PaaD